MTDTAASPIIRADHLACARGDVDHVPGGLPTDA